MSVAKGIFVVAAKRTPFGTYGGKLKDLTPTRLGELASLAALKAGNVNPENIDTVVCGVVGHAANDTAYIARHVGLRVGVPQATPALIVNRLCGSGFQSIVSGLQDILLGNAETAMCVGAENMSMSPFAVRGIRFGTKLGTDYKLEDVLWQTLIDQQYSMPMGMTAENLAEKYDISLEESNTFALTSQTRWANAQKNGHFDAEMAPIMLKGRKGEEEMSVDEHPRPTTMESLAKLPPVFKKGGRVNAGNASGICDGAGAVILASESAVSKLKLTPLARIVSYGISGCDPAFMGIGPVPASNKALASAGLSLKDMDVAEVNEAFAPQFLAVEKELGLDPEKTNVNGGAIAMGHPVGASGSRITANLVHEMRRRNLKYALGSACIGGGQGITIILENV